MKILRIILRVVFAIFVVWGLVALYHTWARVPNQRPFLFWLVLPYPVLVVLTQFVVASCARNGTSRGTGFSWFAVGLGAAASIGLALAVSTSLFSIISWAYFGRVSLGYSGPVDPSYIAINIAASAACYIWAGAMSAALCAQRPLAHAIAAGVALLIWSCAVTTLVQPLVVSQLIAALALPIPLSVLGAKLQLVGVNTRHG